MFLSVLLTSIKYFFRIEKAMDIKTEDLKNLTLIKSNLTQVKKLNSQL